MKPRDYIRSILKSDTEIDSHMIRNLFENKKYLIVGFLKNDTEMNSQEIRTFFILC